MKNTTIFAIFVILLLGVGIFFFTEKGSSAEVQSQKGDVQKITLGMQNYNYYPNTINVKEGQPVEITLDSSVKGCYRSFTIRDLGVVKYSKTEQDTIKFTPNKKGTFRFACSMGMGYGTIVVQ
jgi:P-type Cu+ transporter